MKSVASRLSYWLEHELAGVNREDALKAVAANRWFTSEKGYMEIRPWIMQRFADPEVPKKWLRERRRRATASRKKS